VLFSVPYVPRRKVNQSEWEQQTYPGKTFYQAVLRSPMAEPYLQADVRGSLLRGLYTLSGQAAPEERFQPARDPGPPPTPAVTKRPPWITEEDVDFLEAEFKRTGFTGGLNYYRNMDRNWALTQFLKGAKIMQPTLFVAGDKDPVIGVGHWIQQESPDQVNRLLIEFLDSL
jgi:pimeloyl-ACP methyl ester carboxylesterase